MNKEMLKIGAELLDQIKNHAVGEYPQECCGLLIGSMEDEGRTRRIVHIYPVANAWDDANAKDHRMLIPPEDYRRAELSYIKEGLGVVGDYHSHPEGAAIPSEFDLKHLAQWANMSHVVVSVRDRRAEDVRSWVMEEDHTRFNEEEIVKGN